MLTLKIYHAVKTGEGDNLDDAAPISGGPIAILLMFMMKIGIQNLIQTLVIKMIHLIVVQEEVVVKEVSLLVATDMVAAGEMDFSLMVGVGEVVGEEA